jgi:3D (Asp-Asp-Asp) domain-containing protein
MNMADVLIATATTNTVPASVVPVQVEDLVCSIAIEPNTFGDTLPIIPTASTTQNNKVLYRLILKARLVQHSDGSPAVGHSLAISSSRTADQLAASGTTDANGEMLLTLETREAGDLDLTTTTTGVTLSPFRVSLQEAWYESTFLITGYHVCAEADFSGPLVAGTGLGETHKQDFLFGAAGVPMQGTGQATDGRYIRLQSMSGGWHHNAAGNPDQVNTPAGVSFAYATGVLGAFGTVTVDHSIAVDPHVIPKRARVNIDGVGDRSADDRGSAILGYHIDNFLGAGHAVVTAWLHGGINGTQRQVKYLGN